MISNDVFFKIEFLYNEYPDKFFTYQTLCRPYHFSEYMKLMLPYYWHSMGPLCTLCGFWNFSAYKQNPRFYDDVIKWKHFPRYWHFVREIHRWPVNFPHKGQWRGALMSSLICNSTNGWANHRDDGDLRRHCVHYDVTVTPWRRHDM